MPSNFLEGSDNSLSRDIGRHPKFENFFERFFNLKFPFWIQIHPKWIQNRKFLKTIQVTLNAKKGLCVNQSHSLVDTEALKSHLILLYPMLPLMANLYSCYGMVPFDSNRALFSDFFFRKNGIGHRNRR